MFYLIETKKQLKQFKEKLLTAKNIYLEYIQGNDNTHPLLAEIIAIYLNINKESFIIPINHLECINWDKNAIFTILANK